MSLPPNYDHLFSRNIGIVSESEQKVLRDSTVAIAGLGGVGGVYATTLARMGVGCFHIADFDVFEPGNFNRQQGARMSTLNRPKAEVIKEMILDINPTAKINLFSDGLTRENATQFLAGANVVMDGLDAFALVARRLLYGESEKRDLYVCASGPLGLTATLHVFGPGSMRFEDYYDFRSCNTFEEEMAAFLVGTSPALLQHGQMDMSKVSFKSGAAPSFVTAVQLCAGLACTEVMKILTKKCKPRLAPRYFQFDAYNLRLAKRYLWMGNRNPIQRLKRRFIVNFYRKRAQIESQ